MHFVKRALQQIRDQVAKPVEWVAKKIPPNRFIGRPKADTNIAEDVKEVAQEITEWVLKQKDKTQHEIEKECELAKNRDNKIKYHIMIYCYKLRDRLQETVDKLEGDNKK